MNAPNIKATGRLRKLLDVKSTKESDQKRQILTVDMRSLQGGADTTDMSHQEQGTRPVTSRGNTSDSSYNGYSSSDADKLVRFTNKSIIKNPPAATKADQSTDTSDGILIIHGAIHKISIHGEPHIPRASNGGIMKNKTCGKNRAPTPYPYKEVEQMRRQELMEKPVLQFQGKNNDNNIGKPRETSLSYHQNVGRQSIVRGNSDGWSTKYTNNEAWLKDEERKLDANMYKEYQRSSRDNQGEIIGGQASNRLLCHPDSPRQFGGNHAKASQGGFSDVQHNPIYEHQDRLDRRNFEYRDQNICSEQRPRMPDVFERRHGVSLDSFVLPKVGQNTTRQQQLGGCNSEIIATKGADTESVIKPPSSDVDTLLEQLGWCHGDRDQSEGWLSPRQQEGNDNPGDSGHIIQKSSDEITSKTKKYPTQNNNEDVESSEKKDVAEFRVKIRNMWQKLFH